MYDHSNYQVLKNRAIYLLKLLQTYYFCSPTILSVFIFLLFSMAKLAAEHKFIDVSDYGRPIATAIANALKNTVFTPIHVTIAFGISGLLAVYCILENHYYLAGLFLITKSILDAADGELARIKNTPSYTGRYLDSIFDIILNFLILIAICYVSTSSYTLTLIAFVCVQLQGTLYNYYYVILRNKSIGADTTSKIFEYKVPKAFPNEKQITVDVFFSLYAIAYSIFDKTIHLLDKEAYKTTTFPNWFMSMVSVYGLGFQLLIISFMLAVGLVNFIIPFFVVFTVFILIFIIIRRTIS
jgi:phosphatidylglycerophosphate synthase